MVRGVDGRIREVLKNTVKRELEREDGAVFSQTEVMRRVRDRIRWKGTGDSEALAEMYESGQISRRRFLKMLGVGAGGAVVASSGVGYFFGQKLFDERRRPPTGFQTASLSDSAISSAPGGNVVRVSSLSEAESAFSDGNTVVLAGGTYSDYPSYAEDIFGKDVGNCSLLGDGDVILERSENDHLRPQMDASGNVRIQNMTIRGKRGLDQSRWRFGTSGSTTLELINVNMPDGTVKCSDSTGIYVQDDHNGTINCINCSWQSFGNSACYVRYGNGPVNFDSCFWRNNNGPVRYFPDGSVMQKCVGVEDGHINGFQEGGSSGGCSGSNGRIIKVEEGEGTIQDSDFLISEQCDSPGPVIDIQDDSRSSGHVQNIRVRNETGEPVIKDSGGYADSWSAENICIIGSGSHEVPGELESAVNSNCQTVATEPPTNSNWANTTFGSGGGAGGDSGGSGSNPC